MNENNEILEGSYLAARLHKPGGFPGGSAVKNLPANAGVTIPGLGKSPGGENGNPLQHCCWNNPMDRGAEGAAVRGVAESDTLADKAHMRLNDYGRKG